MTDSADNSEYYLRIVSMYIDLGTETVLKLFYHCKPKEDITQFLSLPDSRKILHNLKQRNVLNGRQYNLVTAYCPDADKFDIVLLITLLTSLFPTSVVQPPRKGWNSKPEDSDLSVGADLLRLRKFRNNVLFHRPNAQLQKFQFDYHWSKISEILIRIVQQIQPEDEEMLSGRIELYKSRNIDAFQRRNYDNTLRAWKDEIDEMQTQVEELLEKLSEFDTFFKHKPERFKRYIKLMIDGGILVLKSVLYNELNERQQDIGLFLKENEKSLKSKMTNTSFIAYLYPKDSSNVECVSADDWDVALLAEVLLYGFDNLTPDVKEDIEAIHNALTCYAETALLSLDSDRFTGVIIELTNRLTSLAAGLDKSTKKQLKDLIAVCSKSDGNIVLPEDYLNSLQSKRSHVKSLVDVHKETISKLKVHLNEMVIGDISLKNEQKLEIKIQTTSPIQNTAVEAEKTVFTVLHESIHKAVDTSGLENVRHEIDTIIESLTSHTDVTKVEVKKHCIFLEITCSSASSIQHVIRVFESDVFQNLWYNLSIVMTNELQDTVAIQTNFTLESLYEVFRSRADEVHDEREIVMQIPYSTLSELKSMLSPFESRELTNRVNRISGQLSSHFNETVTIAVTHGMTGISDSDRSSTSSTSEDIESDEQCLNEKKHLNPENSVINSEEQELTKDSVESEKDIMPSLTSAINEGPLLADLSHICLQSRLDRRRANRITNEEELQGDIAGGESLKWPRKEILNMEFEKHYQGKKETAPPPSIQTKRDIENLFGSGHEAQSRHHTSYIFQKNGIEKGEEDNIQKGHELYLRYIILLLQAAHLALKGFLYTNVKDSNGKLADLIVEKENTFQNSYREVYHLLFTDSGVNTNTDCWDTRLLCVVILVLFHSESDSQRSEYEAVECILDHLKELENYVQSASLDYKTFETKWESLYDAIIELIKDIDDKVKFECKRMILSYKPWTISTSSKVISNLRETNDVNTHVQIALRNIVDLDYGIQGCQGKDQLEKRQNDNIKFTKRLQDKFVYADDSAVLTCELNVSEENVTWRHDYKHIKDSNTIKTLTDGCCQWLAISRAKPEDAGLYTCACCNVSTTAYLMVSETPLMVTKELHVASEDTNVTENMDIVLECKVSHHAFNVTWRHNGEVINSKRHHISLDDNVHKLTILKAQYEDEGEYTVDFGTTSSRTEVTLKAKLSLAHRAQLTNDLYKNWIRGALGLKYLKVGLENVSRSIVEKHHSELLKQLSNIKLTCTQCTIDRLLPAHAQVQCPNRKKCICSKLLNKRVTCPNGGFCSKFFDLVLFDHRFFDLLLTNTDIQKWANDPWSVAKCYINTIGYHDKSSEKEIDCAGLLSIFINNTFFERSLNQIEINGETDVFKKAKDTRNDILHNANYELSEGQMHHCLDLFTSVLEVKDVNGKQALSSYPGTKEAINEMKVLRKREIDIRTPGEFQKEIQELKEHAMTEIAEKIEEATKQNNRKLQQLEKILTENEKELQLLRDVISLQTERMNKEHSQAVFKLDLHLKVIEPTGESSTQGNSRICQSMNNYNSGQNMKTDQHTEPTDASVQHLLEYIKVLENCQIADISNANAAVVVEIFCSTCEAIETLLKLINGNKFQTELLELRKCLLLHDHMEINDVIVSCSSESLEKTRKKIRAKQTQMHFTCEKHKLECTWYCSDHDTFLCPTCKDTDHGRCCALKQVITDRSYKEQKQSHVLKRKIGKYDVRINNILVNKSDNDGGDCDITSIRMLPNGEILLVDRENSRLKKLDRTYNIVSYCDLSYTPRDICYIGNDRAAVCIWPFSIQFVNLSGNMKCGQQVRLHHECYFLACYGETLYVGDSNTIYRYNKDCQQKHVLYTCHDDNPRTRYRHMAVSDDGERIYIASSDDGLITIDKEGKHLSTLTVTVYLTDVCVVGDGTVLVADTSGGVYQVNYRGEKVLGTFISSASGLKSLQSLCFDRRRCRLLVADKSNSITGFKLIYNYC